MMNWKASNLILGLRLLTAGLAILTILSFQFEGMSQRDRQLIEGAIKEKVGDFVAKKKKRCREKVLTRANEIVDSTLIARAKLLINQNNINRPPRPVRPVPPGIIFPKVDGPIEPIIDLDSFLNFRALGLDSVLTDSILGDSILLDSFLRDAIIQDSISNQ